MTPRFEIAPKQIDEVVTAFYAKVRAHPTLGPVFQNHIRDWPSHEAKIAGFWRNAILLERSYSGNPMQIHQAAGDVHSEHFPMWLEMFDGVLKEQLSNEIAIAWSLLAHRIGRGLSMGLQRTKHANMPPMLG